MTEPVCHGCGSLDLIFVEGNRRDPRPTYVCLDCGSERPAER